MAVISRADPFDLVCRICGCRCPALPSLPPCLPFNSLVMRRDDFSPKRETDKGERSSGRGGEKEDSSGLKVYLKGQCHMFGVLCVF